MKSARDNHLEATGTSDPFSLTFPQATTCVVAPDSCSVESQPAKVTIVDDDPLNIALVSRMLEEAGFIVRVASSGEDYLCLLALGGKRSDVLITDVLMPGMSGFELLEHVKQSDPCLSVIVMTGEDGYENVRKALSLGAFGYLAKPFEQPEDVLQVVRSATETTRLTRANKRLLEQLSEQNAQLRHMAITDQLTGVFNRRHIDNIFDAEVECCEKNEMPFSLLLLDIDHFKSVNDDHGHCAGDTVLSKIASLLGSAIRNIDSLGRYGGEEFMIVLPETDPDDAFAIATKLCLQIEGTSIDVGAEQLSVTASFGVAGFCASAHSQSSRALFKAADSALYKAKKSGRNCVVRGSFDGDGSA